MLVTCILQLFRNKQENFEDYKRRISFSRYALQASNQEETGVDTSRSEARMENVERLYKGQ